MKFDRVDSAEKGLLIGKLMNVKIGICKGRLV